MATATGTFEVTGGGEDVYRQAEGEVKLTRARGTQRFSGDLVGEGSVEWVFCYFPAGGGRFLGLQRIEGLLGGRRGSFVLESIGDHDGRQSRGVWRVIPGSGTGELEGITGQGDFHAPGGREVSYMLEYELA
jgi:hypothetical protein